MKEENHNLKKHMLPWNETLKQAWQTHEEVTGCLIPWAKNTRAGTRAMLKSKKMHQLIWAHALTWWASGGL